MEQQYERPPLRPSFEHVNGEAIDIRHEPRFDARGKRVVAVRGSFSKGAVVVICGGAAADAIATPPSAEAPRETRVSRVQASPWLSCPPCARSVPWLDRRKLPTIAGVCFTSQTDFRRDQRLPFSCLRMQQTAITRPTWRSPPWRRSSRPRGRRCCIRCASSVRSNTSCHGRSVPPPVTMRTTALPGTSGHCNGSIGLWNATGARC